MAFDFKTLLLPPSPLYPLAGLGLAYLIAPAGAKGWAMAAGALAGLTLNAASRSMQAQSLVAKASGASSFQSSLGAEILSAGIGTHADKDPATVAAGSLTGGIFDVGRPSIRQEMNRPVIFPMHNPHGAAWKQTLR